MGSPPDRADYESFEAWIAELAAQAESDPQALVDEILAQLDREDE